MVDETRSPKKARPLLVIGAALHVTGLLVYDSFPYLYLISIPVLCWSYYLFLAGNGNRPLATPAFWGMAIVLAIPIVGLLAGIQQILFTPKKGDRSKPNRLLSSLVSLIIFIPVIAVFVALGLPAFPDAPAGLMSGILICAAVLEAALIAAVILTKRKI